MTRSGKGSRGPALAALFGSDPEAAVLRVLREAGAALTAVEIKNVLAAAGVDRAEADRAWPAVQKRIRSHAEIAFEGQRYQWQPARLSPAQALELLLKGELADPQKVAVANVVRAALASPPPGLRWQQPHLEEGPADQHDQQDQQDQHEQQDQHVQVPRRELGDQRDPEGAARRRQAEIDAIRALAELASEVEELTVNEVEPKVLIRQVRAWVKRSGLEPIDRAGEETAFDRKRHRAIGRPIREGAPVVVVRPGYVWKASSEDVVLGKAVVEE